MVGDSPKLQQTRVLTARLLDLYCTVRAGSDQAFEIEDGKREKGRHDGTDWPYMDHPEIIPLGSNRQGRKKKENMRPTEDGRQ